MPKKKWEKPKLVVLVRGKPEERVLQACKSNLFATGPSTDVAFCTAGAFVCFQCIVFVSS